MHVSAPSRFSPNSPIRGGTGEPGLFRVHDESINCGFVVDTEKAFYPEISHWWDIRRNWLLLR